MKKLNKESFLEELKNDQLFRLKVVSLLLEDIKEHLEIETQNNDHFSGNEIVTNSALVSDIDLLNLRIERKEEDEENKEVINLFNKYWSNIYSKYMVKTSICRGIFFNSFKSLDRVKRANELEKIIAVVISIQSKGVKESEKRAMKLFGYSKYYAKEILENMNKKNQSDIVKNSDEI